MANFQIAEQITGHNEGGYANNKKDRGGETYAGIARNFWPQSKIWMVIDQIKKDNGNDPAVINNYAKRNPELKTQISAFYKINFWNVNSLDAINDQQLANSVYDFGVNSGTYNAGKKLQDAFNNLRGDDLVPLSNDGKIGSKTITAVNSYPVAALHREYNRLREVYYRKLAEEPSQKQFLQGWLSRLKPYKLPV